MISYPATPNLSAEIVGHTRFAAWCVDASPMIDQTEPPLIQDGRWVAEQWAEYLDSSFDDAVADLKLVIRNGLHAITSRFAARATRRDPDDANPRYPGAYLSTVVLNGTHLLGYAIGDTPVVVLTHDNAIQIFHDDRIATRAGAPFGDDRDQPRSCTEENRAGGYWILRRDMAAVRHGLQFVMPASEVKAVLLCSDGLLQLIQPIFRDLPSFSRAVFADPQRAAHAVLNRSAATAQVERLPASAVLSDVSILVLRVQQST